MLFDNNVVTNGKTKASALSGRFGRKEWVEHFFLYAGRDASAVVADADFHTIAAVSSCSDQGWLVVAAICFPRRLIAA
jgi:hypothetical protein